METIRGYVSIIYRTSIECLSNIYRRYIEPLSTINRNRSGIHPTPMEHISTISQPIPGIIRKPITAYTCICRMLIEHQSKIYRTYTEHPTGHLSRRCRAAIEQRSSIYRDQYRNPASICRRSVGGQTIIHPTSIEQLSTILRQSFEQLSNIYRTFIELLSNIYRTSIEHLLNVFRSCIERLSNIYRTSIEHLSNL